MLTIVTHFKWYSHVLSFGSSVQIWNYSPPPQYRPSVDHLPINTAADFQVPNTFFLVIYDSLYRRFSNTSVFSPVPRAGYGHRHILKFGVLKLSGSIKSGSQTLSLQWYNIKSVLNALPF